jgi:hypothetical protein
MSYYEFDIIDDDEKETIPKLDSDNFFAQSLAQKVVQKYFEDCEERSIPVHIAMVSILSIAIQTIYFCSENRAGGDSFIKQTVNFIRKELTERGKIK